ncbi:MAG: hypothetical protein P9L94_08110 [Candidatus Hinthialibacter antarcticus]|nr:hypothetical protein [Candidatus Hinthialibacter antarcticus]
MKNVLLCLITAMAFASCSGNQGELVDAPEGASTPPQVAQSSELPSSHPPINQSQPQGETMLMPGPKAEPLEVAGGQATAAGLSFKIDPSWSPEQPSSSFRAAQFRLSAPEGVEGSGELALFQGIGGSAQQNIDRWIGQMQSPVGEPEQITKTVNGLAVQTLDVKGTLAVGAMMGGGEATAGMRMLAAVIEGPGGPWHWKLTGPDAVLEHWKPAFNAMVDSTKPAE